MVVRVFLGMMVIRQSLLVFTLNLCSNTRVNVFPMARHGVERGHHPIFRHALSFLSSSDNKIPFFLIYTANLMASSGRARVSLRLALAELTCVFISSILQVIALRLTYYPFPSENGL
jgi:hypothetical protein